MSSLAEQTRERLRLNAAQQAKDQHKALLQRRKEDARKDEPTNHWGQIKEDPNFGRDVEKVYVKALYDYPGQEHGHLSFNTVSITNLVTESHSRLTTGAMLFLSSSFNTARITKFLTLLDYTLVLLS